MSIRCVAGSIIKKNRRKQIMYTINGSIYHSLAILVSIGSLRPGREEKKRKTKKEIMKIIGLIAGLLAKKL